ncbi:protein translocase subunit SecF [Salarchaeum sp. III]|uniref:protein translocase subunit SecF n=1 Tax=Salarchaeum sp. III TaxID=3107927 RepID=UPI002ED93382
MPSFEVPEVDFSRYSNRQLLVPPLAALLVALVVLAGAFALTGTPVPLGIEFTGGTELTVTSPAQQSAVVSAFSQHPPESVRAIPSRPDTYVLTFQAETGQTQAALQDYIRQRISASSVQMELEGLRTTSATFGANNQEFALIGMLIAFGGMSVVVFALFRSFVPSFAVVASAFSDIVIPLALMNLFGIPLSLGTVAALLMLIGYSVDSDILLTNHVLRRSGSFYESVDRAFKTGATMTVTSLVAMIVMTIVAYAFGIELLSSIGMILAFGLATDLMNTYMLNLSLLRWYKYEGVSR